MEWRGFFFFFVVSWGIAGKVVVYKVGLGAERKSERQTGKESRIVRVSRGIAPRAVRELLRTRGDCLEPTGVREVTG